MFEMGWFNHQLEKCFVNVWAKLSGGQDGNDLYVQLLLGATLYSELQDTVFGRVGKGI